jgi:hypothetical protein
MPAGVKWILIFGCFNPRSHGERDNFTKKERKMFKKIGTLLVNLLSIALMGYSASRSLDFVMLTLPPDKQILAYFTIAALDGGVIIWLLSYMHGARGGWQRAISLMMVVVDTLGAIVLFTSDALYRAGERGVIAGLSEGEIRTVILAMSGIIAINIAAGIAYHLTDPDRLKKQAEEEAFARIEEAAIEQIARSAEQLASQLAPTLAAQWVEETRAKYLKMLPGAAALPATMPSAGLVIPDRVRVRTPETQPLGNLHRPENPPMQPFGQFHKPENPTAPGSNNTGNDH